MILFLDNYDSFTYNLYQYIGELYPDIQVVRNDEITLEEIEAMHPDALLISPGPGYPKDAGISIPAIQKFAGKMPILGICLGHQAIAEAFGGKIVKAEHLMHGKASNIAIDNQSVLFAGLPQVIACGRYHSLIVEEASLPSCLRITARDENGQIMALEHTKFPIYGLQFHPESILSEDGKEILIRFLNLLPGVSIPTKQQTPQQPKKALLPYAEKVLNGGNLTETEAMEAMDLIMSNAATDIQIAEFLTALRMKGETIEEITGFAKGMRAKAKTVPNCKDAIDIVGTGGDCSNSFNISTTSSFIIAAAGAKVAKHGNYGATSVSGASNVIEQHGVRFTNNPDTLKRSMEECNIAYLHAQLFNPAMKFVGPVRKTLGVRTLFNLLGPLVNPCCPAYQLLGVADLSQMRLYTNVFYKLGIDFAVVNSLDSYDEISLTDEFKVMTRNYERIYRPQALGFKDARPEELFGGVCKEDAARIFDNILTGHATPAQTQCVIVNAAFAIQVMEPQKEIEECIAIARESLDSGRALATLKKFIEINK